MFKNSSKITLNFFASAATALLFVQAAEAVGFGMAPANPPTASLGALCGPATPNDLQCNGTVSSYSGQIVQYENYFVEGKQRSAIGCLPTKWHKNPGDGYIYPLKASYVCTVLVNGSVGTTTVPPLYPPAL